MYEDWYNKGIKRIADIVDEKGKFISLDQLTHRFNINKNQYLLYSTLKCCIPTTWRRILKSNDKGQSSVYDMDDWNIYVNIGDEIVTLDRCKTKSLYNAYIYMKAQKDLKCFGFWKKLLNIDKEDLTPFFLMPFKYIRDCKIQSLQYKILHNIYSNNLRQRQWRVRDDDYCNICKESDTLLHHFCLCETTELFWNGLVNWFNTTTDNDYTLSYQDILLGYTNITDHTLQWNFIILHAKWYIFRCKYIKEKCFLLEYLPELKTRLKAERLIFYNRKELAKFESIWQAIYDEL
jgi:hypothetical protein